jgi:hypothetical protein
MTAYTVQAVLCPAFPRPSAGLLDALAEATGNSAAAALRRLERSRPDILDRVLAGELSPHAGMLEAGFRRRPAKGAQVAGTPK